MGKISLAKTQRAQRMILDLPDAGFVVAMNTMGKIALAKTQRAQRDLLLRKVIDGSDDPIFHQVLTGVKQASKYHTSELHVN
jgi:hypothetical protein